MIEQRDIQRIQTGNPFPGLRPFNTDESLLFFGREGLSDTLLEKLRATRFVAVIGTSGSGKSSLVRAGLLPALRSGFMTDAGCEWRVALFRPINNPIHHLATALLECNVFPADGPTPASARLRFIEDHLRRSSLGLIETVRLASMSPTENLLIVADQFEELYRFEPSAEVEHPKDEASAFVKLLLEATRQSDLPIYVILTMRSDYLGESAHFWGLPEAINRGQFLIPRMDDDERREAIEGPVKIRGGEISWPLVNRLLNDAGDDPRQLPIMQHALMRTWEYWDQNRKDSEPLRLEHYHNNQVGSMKQALSIHVDEAFKELTPAEKLIAEKMFKRLTEKGGGKREGRLPATVEEIAKIADVDIDAVMPVIEVFRKDGRSFLMPPPAVPLTGSTLIDISHESLINGWTRLSLWVEEEAYSAKTYRRLVDDALLYPTKKGELTNPELGFTLKWKSEQRPNETWARRYRTAFGKSLDENPSTPRPSWARADDSEFEVAMRYLDISERKHNVTSARKERRRWRFFAYVSFAAALLFFACVALAIFSAKAKQEQVNADRQRALAEEQKGIAEREKNNAELARADADRLKGLALTAQHDAEETAKAAEQQRKIAVAAQRLAQIQAKRGSLLREAIYAEQNGDFDEAVKKYSDLRTNYAGDSWNLAFTEILMGNTILRSSGDKEAALAHYDRVLEMATKRTVQFEPSVFIKIADKVATSFLSYDNPDAAVKYYDYVVDNLSKADADLKTDLLISGGQLYARSGSRNLEKAVQRYRKASDCLAQTDPKQVKINMLIGEAYQRVRRFPEARDAYEVAANLSPKNSVSYGDAYRRIGDTYLSENENRKALESYNKAHVAYAVGDPSSLPASRVFGDARVLESIGQIREREADRVEAMPFYRQALNLYRQVRGPVKDSDDETYIRDAYYAYDRLRNLVPNLDDVLMKTIEERGIEAGKKQYADLKRSRSPEFDFTDDQVLNRLGYNLIRKKKLTEAIEIFKLNVDEFPKVANTYDSLGEGYKIAGNKQLAISYYEKALQLDPKKESAIRALKELKGQQ
jgi:tetratricopeptide (TPR) repeat protein